MVASSIVIAALGMPGSTYDRSWMLPFGPWMERLPYKSLPIPASLAALRALNAWVAAVVGQLPDGLSREVCLRDSAEAELRRVYSKKGTPSCACFRIPSSSISTPMPGFSESGMCPSTTIGSSNSTISRNIGSLWK